MPAGKRWRLIGITFRLATSATVATRHVSFVLDDGNGSNLLAFGLQSTDQAASSGAGYVVGEGYGQFLSANSQLNAGTIQSFLWPRGVEAAAGMRYRTKTGNLQAGDQFSGNFDAAGNPIVYLVEEWDA